MNYRGRRATIMGLGHFGGGTAAARWLAQQGAQVAITDLADKNALADSLALLADVPIASIRLGSHREEDFHRADLVVVNPAVRPTSPWLAVARQSGARLCTEIELFIENCPARIVGVTGSNGKSTTAAMIASILEAAGRRSFLGGNIGGSLLERLPEMTCNDWAVLEMSSFQLWHFSPEARMPRAAVVTGCTPNHLDWHGSFAEYAAAKQRILTGQSGDDFAVLNTFDAEAAAWTPRVRARLVPLPPPDDLPPLPVPGRHNRLNAAMAAAAATAVGCGPEAIRRGLEHFHPLPQRLEWIATIDHRHIYSDSTSTTPESTVAALQSLDAPIRLLAGGKNKGSDLRPLAGEIALCTRGAAFFGEVREELRRLTTTAAAEPFACTAVETLDEALQWCWSQSEPGDAILLSPGCASTDQFRNFQHRGRRFVELVDGLANLRNR